MDVTEDIEEEIQQENEEHEGSSGDDECSSSSDEEEEEIGEGLGLESRTPLGQMDNRQDVTEEISMMSLENKISPLTFCNAFPFHLVLDRNLHVRQVSLFNDLELQMVCLL